MKKLLYISINIQTMVVLVCQVVVHKSVVSGPDCPVLFLVQFNNFDRTVGFYWRYTLLLEPPILTYVLLVHVKCFYLLDPPLSRNFAMGTRLIASFYALLFDTVPLHFVMCS